ncbi:MAG: GtrA family protein [Spirochaetales bacterium]|nr:GtrA family protein [Spirochaetales bacterium]
MSDKAEGPTGGIAAVIEKYGKGIVQFVKFNAVGIINTAITFLVFTLLNKLIGLDKFIAEPSGYVCGLINSYFLNKIWTFGKKHHYRLSEALKFIIVNAFALGGTLLILHVAEDILSIDVLWGKLMAYCYSVPVNYIGFKYWVFRT